MQMAWQRAATLTTLRRALFPQLWITLLRCGLNLFDGLLEILKRELTLILAQALRFAAELQTNELPYQMLLLFDLLQQHVTFRHQRRAFRCHRQHKCSQCIGIRRQIGQLVARVGHRAYLTQRPSVCESFLSLGHVTNRARQTATHVDAPPREAD